MAVAKIIDKGPGDHTLILGTRSQLIYPFEAPDWSDLRVGFLLSITQATADDTIAPPPAMIENLDIGNNPPQDHTYIGIKTNNDSLPFATGTGFIGYSTNVGNSRFGGELVSSDAAIGAGTTFWRPRISELGGTGHNDLVSATMVDEGRMVTPAFLHVQPHFPQNVAGAGGYATLLMLRIQRSSTGVLTVSIKQGTDSGDVIHTNTPTLDILEANLGSYPTTVQTKTVNRMANIPDALYLYWPFHLSRLRCHALGFMKFR